jgi:hypothetical protein
MQHKGIYMATKNTAKKIQEQITDAVKNPQEFATNLNEKNQEFAKEIQQVLQAFPQEVLSQQKEVQERVTVCIKKIQEIVSTQPVDIVQLQQTLFQFHTDNFAYQTKLVQDQIKKTQELFGIYTK